MKVLEKVDALIPLDGGDAGAASVDVQVRSGAAEGVHATAASGVGEGPSVHQRAAGGGPEVDRFTTAAAERRGAAAAAERPGMDPTAPRVVPGARAAAAPGGAELLARSERVAVRRAAELGLFARLDVAARADLGGLAELLDELRRACVEMPESIERSLQGYTPPEDRAIVAAFAALCTRLEADCGRHAALRARAEAALGAAAVLLPPAAPVGAVAAAVQAYRAGRLTSFELVGELGRAWQPPPAALSPEAVRGELVSRATSVRGALAALPKNAARRVRADHDLLLALLGARAGAVVDVARGKDTLEHLVGLVAELRRATFVDLDIIALGGGRVLVGDALRVDSLLTDLGLDGLDSTATLRRLRAAGPEEPELAAALAAGPERLGRLDLPAGASLAELGAAAVQGLVQGTPVELPAWAGRVRDLGIITYDRPERLEQTLASYLESLQRFGRSDVTVHVFDDSSGAAAAGNEALVAGLAVAGHRLTYVGPRTKEALLAQLVPEVARLLGWPTARARAALDKTFGAAAGERWRGGISTQRNWTSLWSAGSRALLVDDDTYAQRLVARDPDPAASVIGAAAALRQDGARLDGRGQARRDEEEGRRTLAELLAPTEVAGFVGVPIDIVGAGERQPDVPMGAQADGHIDYKAGVVIGSFLSPEEGAAGWLSGATPLRPHQSFDGGFRGSCYVTSSSLEGIDFTLRTGRDEDFALALTRSLTSRRAIQPEAGDDFVHLHERGVRSSNQAKALLQEGESGAFTRAVASLFADYWRRHPVFDAARFAETAQAALAAPALFAHVDASAVALRDQARLLADTAVERLAELEAVAAALAAAAGEAVPAAAAPLYARWYEARLHEHDAAWAERLAEATRGARRKRGRPANPERAAAAVLAERQAELGAALPGRSTFLAALRHKVELTRALVAQLRDSFGLDQPDAAFAAAMTARLRAEVAAYVEGVAAFAAAQVALPAALRAVAAPAA